MALYTWGGTTTTTLNEMHHAIHSHLSDRLTKGPGWTIRHTHERYDIEIVVKLQKRPPKPNICLHGSGT